MSDRQPSPVVRTLREVAVAERPRERLLLHGAGTLSESELVAILLGSGLAGENVAQLAGRLLASLGQLEGLMRSDAAALQRVRGLGPARAAVLVAACELGRRMAALGPTARPRLDTPEAVAAFVGPRLQGLARERLMVVSLDAKNRPLGQPAVVEGGVGSVGARPADVFREPIVLCATSVALAHNHPSGDPAPSAQDIAVTRELVLAGRALDLELLDHVIIGQGGFVSLRRQGTAFQ